MLGEIFDADTALRWGLVERLVAPEALDAEVGAMLTVLLSAGPQVVPRQKALMQVWEKLPADAGIQAGIDAFIAAYETDEPTRMLSAFVKRKWE